MTRFSDFTDDELDMMEEAFCNEGLKYLVFEIRKERNSRMFVEPQERSDKCSKCKYHINPDYTRCKECGAERSDKE